jgi:hypothetical protein
MLGHRYSKTVLHSDSRLAKTRQPTRGLFGFLRACFGRACSAMTTERNAKSGRSYYDRV